MWMQISRHVNISSSNSFKIRDLFKKHTFKTMCHLTPRLKQTFGCHFYFYENFTLTLRLPNVLYIIFHFYLLLMYLIVEF